MTAVPAATPVTIPVDPIVTLPLLALQAPPVDASVSERLCPIHISIVPFIGEGDTVIVVLTVLPHPVLSLTFTK